MYKILFKNNEIFTGGEPENSLWNKIPDKPILSLKYSLFDKTYLFQGFDKYNHIVKSGLTSKGYNGIISIFIMGLYKEEIHQIIFNYFTKIITKKTIKIGKEYNNNFHPGWKEGIVSNKIPTIYEIQTAVPSIS